MINDPRPGEQKPHVGLAREVASNPLSRASSADPGICPRLPNAQPMLKIPSVTWFANATVGLAGDYGDLTLSMREAESAPDVIKPILVALSHLRETGAIEPATRFPSPSSRGGAETRR
jgi:hypothetical protein